MDLRKKIFLIDKTIDTINEKKLSTNKEALQLLFHHTRDLNKSVNDSCSIVVSEVKQIWEKAETPTQENSRCVAKLIKLYTDYRDAQKSVSRNNERKEQIVCNNLEKLFDIAHGNTFAMIDKETAEFLIDQRTQRMLHLKFNSTNIDLSPVPGVLISSPELNTEIQLNDEFPENSSSTHLLTATSHVVTSPEKSLILQVLHEQSMKSILVEKV
ncbi:PREDICTED: uncharacterized protein LOC108370541 [Rhagoletis zephyria]|uniref:uncharacterized protein LOC108370541 n=1 Tax=Rhagoletis zephyria TaxID=28612 RepID=UPI0008113927|nr:PREDICTED: uncharacterized protein LOC108370541 [Rhagoletis zephyria]